MEITWVYYSHRYCIKINKLHVLYNAYTGFIRHTKKKTCKAVCPDLCMIYFLLTIISILKLTYIISLILSLFSCHVYHWFLRLWDFSTWGKPGHFDFWKGIARGGNSEKKQCCFLQHVFSSLSRFSFMRV